MSFWWAAEMSNDSQGSVKGDAAMILSPSGSASSQGPPLSPSTTSKPPELPGMPVCVSLICLSSTCVLELVHVCKKLRVNKHQWYVRVLLYLCVSVSLSHLSHLDFLICLKDELVQAGWAKCWSRRENRPYYFNRFTNQSLWEVPVLGQHDVIVSFN